VLISTEKTKSQRFTLVSKLEQLDLLGGDDDIDLVVIDARLDPHDWREPIRGLVEDGNQLEAVIWWPKDSQLFKTAELIRLGLEVVRTLDDVPTPPDPPEAGQQLEFPETGRSEAEFITLLGTEGSLDTLRSLTRAVGAMRRRMPDPLWTSSPPTNGAATFTPGKGQQPSLQFLLEQANSNTFERFATFLNQECKTLRIPPSTLIVGATGTGKTAMARQLHGALYPDDSDDRPFVELNAATLRGNLFNDQFFGHTDAYTDVGVVVSPAGQATFGTLFIDEVGDLSLKGQKGLLTFLTDRKARFYGTHCDITLPMHIVAATNRPLAEMVRAGTFRADLYNRFAHVIEIQSLADRLENADETKLVVRALLTDPEVNPVLERGLRTGEHTVVGVDDGVYGYIEEQDFATGNFRELIGLLRLGVDNAASRRDQVLRKEHFPQATKDVVEGDLQGTALGLTLGDLEAQLTMTTVEIEDASALALDSREPLLRTADGRRCVVRHGVIWVEARAD
jgi:hypothetical protein